VATILKPTGAVTEPKIPGGGRGRGDDLWRGGDGGEFDWPEKYRTGTWLGLAGILMMFLAFTSAYVVSRAKLYPIEMPQVLWLSTAIIITSSLAIEAARRALERGKEDAFHRWMMITTALGIAFLASQLVAWRQLVASGFYLTANRHTQYAYVLTVLHGLHLVGGLLALGYVMIRGRWNWAAARRRVTVEMTAVYWHFLDGLWIYLFILLFFWR
jgi:cytochrome c oxidase subunit 3